MRLPTVDQAKAIAGTHLNSCAFPCKWQTWTGPTAKGGQAYPSVVTSGGTTTTFLSTPTGTCGALCVSGDLTSWTEHDGAYWSDLSSVDMTWDTAYNYCVGIGGAMPTIDELRTLVQGCPVMETGGSCGIVDVNASATPASCTSCTSATDGRYSVFGDSHGQWAYSTPTPVKFWFSFTTAGFSSNNAYNHYLNAAPLRCIRR